MGVASPLQSPKPIEYWLGGLKTAELVQLWDFLSGNQTDNYELDRNVFEENMQPTAEEVRKHLYSESMPHKFYVQRRSDVASAPSPQKGQ